MNVPTQGIPTIEEYIERANQWLNFRRKKANTTSDSYYNYLNEVTLLQYWLIPYYSFLNGRIYTEQYCELNQKLRDSIQTFFSEKVRNSENGKKPEEISSKEMLEAAKRLRDETIEMCYEFGIPTEMVNNLLEYRTIERMMKDKEIEF